MERRINAPDPGVRSTIKKLRIPTQRPRLFLLVYFRSLLRKLFQHPPEDFVELSFIVFIVVPNTNYSFHETSAYSLSVHFDVRSLPECRTLKSGTTKKPRRRYVRTANGRCGTQSVSLNPR